MNTSVIQLAPLHTVQSKAKKNLRNTYPLNMHAFCHLEAQTKISGQIFQFFLARLRDILPYSQAHALKHTVQLKVIKGKKILLGKGSTLLLCKKLIF